MCAPRGACDAPWHHRAPSASQIRQVVRAPCRIRNIAAFNRASFACAQLAWRRAPAHATDPHRLPAGRAYTELPQALAPSVVRWCVAGLPQPTNARLATPKGATQRIPPDQSHSSHEPVKARDPRDSGYLRLARPSLSRRKTASAKRNRLSAAVRTPSSQAPDARPVRVVGLADLLSRRAAAAPACRPLHGTDASNQSLQPTSCHEYPESHAIPRLPAFAVRLPRTSSCFQLSGSPAFRPRPPSAALDCHCWRFQPWIDRAVGADAASCYRTITPEGVRGVPPFGSGGRFRPARARWPDSQTPHVATHGLYPASRARPREPGPASPQPNQRMRLRKPEAPSTSKSHRRRPGLRPNGDRMGRHWYPGLAAKGPASDMRSRPNPRGARPKRLPAVRRGP
jgi:hypothetical protein